MAVTLEWVRDNYDNDPKNRYINDSEVSMASFDVSHGTITQEQFDAVKNAWVFSTLLPDYGFNTLSTGVVSTFNIPNGATLEVDGVEVI